MNAARRLAFALAIAALGIGGYVVARATSKEAPKAAPATGGGSRTAPEPSAPALAGAPPGKSAPDAAAEVPERKHARVITGTLRGPGGGPLPPGVRVRALPLDPEGLPSPWIPTDTAGMFRIESLESRTYRIVARTAVSAPEVPVLDSVDARRRVLPPLVLDLPEGGPPTAPPSRHVRVRGPAGEAVAAAHVMVVLDGRFAGFVEVAGGQFDRMTVEPWSTRYEVFQANDAHGDALPFGPATLRAEDAPDAETTDLALPAGLVLEGRVVDAANLPLPGLPVAAYPIEPPESALSKFQVPNAHGTATTDGDGGFRLLGLGSLSYRVTVDAGNDRVPPPPVEAKPGTSGLVLRARRAVSATVRVLGPDGGPVEKAIVTATVKGSQPGDPGAQRNATADAAGLAVLGGLDPEATLLLQAGPPFERTDLRAARVREWKAKDDTVTLDRDHGVRGVLRDADGQGVVGFVLLRDALGVFKPAAGTARDGTFLLRGLEPGTVVLCGVTKLGGVQGPEVTATVDAEAPVVLPAP